LLRIQEEDSDDEDSKGKTKFNFSGMSFAEYISSIKEGLNNEMRDIVNTFVKQKAARHPSVHLVQRRFQLKHPIFRLLTINAFKYIIDRAYLFKLSPGQAAYRQGLKAMPNVYFVLYGDFDYRFEGSSFGERCGLGWTIGEEIIYTEGPLKRLETVVAQGAACLLQLKIKDLDAMINHKDIKLGGGATLKNDYEVLLSFLGSNYDTKTVWRKDVGIIPKSPKTTQNKFGTFQSTGEVKLTDAMRASFKHPNAS
jgi:hypothetical protein